MENSLSTIKLKSLSVEDLKELLIQTKEYSIDDLEKKNNSELITLIEAKIDSNQKLKSQLSKLDFSFKPSFYLTFIKDKTDYSKSLVTKKKIELKLNLLNNEKDTEKYPSIRGYQLFEINKSDEIIELHFLWQKIHWYWNPSFKLSHIYELNYGLALIDLKNNKGIISCHTKQERDDLFRVISDSIKIDLKPLHLTKPLLNQIGSFDTVKRARYFVSSRELPLPQNITIGDDNLSTKPLAKEQEENDDITRKESFYRIPLKGIEEQGVGVTSETGKLWIPQKVTVTEIKSFSLSLLAKVATELDSLALNGEYEKVLNSLGIKTTKELISISNISLREEIYRLFISIANMLINEVSEKAFTPNQDLLCDGIPNYFNPFKLIISNEIGNSFYGKYHNIFKLKKESTDYNLISFIDKNEIKEIVDTDTGEVIEIKDAIENILLTPTPKLEQIFLGLVKLLSVQYPKLSNVISLPFRIEANVIHMDINRALGKSQVRFATEINANEINELKQILNKSYGYNLPDKTLYLMGEKCDNMTDVNCSNCVLQNQYVCLRTIVARTMKNPLLLAHKGIELSDLQGEYSIDSTTLKIFIFAKLAKGNGSLTARNDAGAILLGQILNQVDKSEFNTVTILTSSTINEDLLSRFRLLCSTFSKKLLIINTQELEKLLGHWYNDMIIEGKKPIEILKNSGKTIKTAMNKYCR
jgi:hypothetical protein